MNDLFFCSICGDGYPCFEISAVNADKPPLTISQIKDRVNQFEKVGESYSSHLLSDLTHLINVRYYNFNMAIFLCI